MIKVASKKELKKAIQNKEKKIIVTGSLATTLKPFAKSKKLDKKSIGNTELTLASMGSIGFTSAVTITLIITLGLVVIIAILKDYDVSLKDGDKEIILERS